MQNGPKLLTCPRCHDTYLGYDPLPDCPHCGYDYKESKGSRWSGLVYLLVILGILTFFMTASYYQGILGGGEVPSIASQPGQGQPYEKLPGSRTP